MGVRRQALYDFASPHSSWCRNGLGQEEASGDSNVTRMQFHYYFGPCGNFIANSCLCGASLSDPEFLTQNVGGT